MNPVVLLPGEGERIEADASIVVMKATAAMTAGAFSMSEATFPAGMNGPPPHSHNDTTDRRTSGKLHPGASWSCAHVRQHQQ